MKGPVSMPKFGNREDEEIGIFLRRYEQAGLAQNWTHADLLQRLPLSLTHGASSWHSRVAIPANWQDVKALMLREFRPHGYLEYKQKALVRRMMLQGESVNDYYEAVMLLYDIMESLGKSFTDQEKADKLGSGLHGTLYKDVAMMSPTSPQDFLMKTGKAIDLEKKAQRQQRGFRDQALPNTIKDPIMDENNGKSQNFKNRNNGNQYQGNYRGSNFQQNYQGNYRGTNNDRGNFRPNPSPSNGFRYNDNNGSRYRGAQNPNQSFTSRFNGANRGGFRGGFGSWNDNNRGNYNNRENQYNGQRPFNYGNTNTNQWQENQVSYPRPLPAIEAPPSQDSRKSPACYNCGGPHFKSQCTLPTTGGPQARRQLNCMDRVEQPDLRDLSINIIEMGTDKLNRPVMNLTINDQVIEACITRQREMSAISWALV